VIRSFADRRTAALFEGRVTKCVGADVARRAQRKLRLIDGAADLDDLSSPPGNRLEPLVGDRRGQHSVRVNDQWRICFVWRDGHAFDVEFVDYH
jgi:proteic killer suppression protein